MEKGSLRILFIGNSHTYYNDMPAMVKAFLKDKNCDCHVTMLAQPGWFLAQHVEAPDTSFNIRFGGYDYVVLQEHAHPFGPVAKYLDAARTLIQWIREAGAVPVIYSTWAKRDEPSAQQAMDEAHRRAADENGALLAPVGEQWWDYREIHKDLEMYASDGAHASPEGSRFAATVIAECIWMDWAGRH